MRPLPAALPLLVLLAAAGPALAQDWRHPRIPDYGGVVAVPGAALMPSPTERHRVVFDLASAETKDGVNAGLWYLARLYNLMALAGVPADSLEVAGVLHGGATALALSDEASRGRSAGPNPDLALMRALAAVGARFYVCGQSAAAHGIDIGGDLNDVTTPALSAMTTLVALRRAGFVEP